MAVSQVKYDILRNHDFLSRVLKLEYNCKVNIKNIFYGMCGISYKLSQ